MGISNVNEEGHRTDPLRVHIQHVRGERMQRAITHLLFS